jgi:hypothetical protein
MQKVLNAATFHFDVGKVTKQTVGVPQESMTAELGERVRRTGHRRE